MVVFYILIGIAALLIVIAAVLYFITLYSKPKRRLIPWDMPTKDHEKHMADPDLVLTEGWIREILDLPYESVGITSRDGLKLAGRYYSFSESAPVVIMIHGYKGDGPADFRGIFQAVRSLGYNILLVSQRSHSESEGRTIALSLRERFDCLDWARFAAEKFGPERDLALFGASMGAATVLASSELDLPESVKCIAADCGFTSSKAIVIKIMRELKLPFLYPLVWLGAFLFGGIRITPKGAVDAVKKNTRPLLFIHGEKDAFVPCDMSREMYKAAAGEKRLVTFENATHLHSYIFNPEAYTKELSDFFGKYLPIHK